MRPSAVTVLQAIEAYWDTYSASPSRLWLTEYTGLSSSTIYQQVRNLAACGYVYAPKHLSYIRPIRKRKIQSEAISPWHQEPVRI